MLFSVKMLALYLLHFGFKAEYTFLFRKFYIALQILS
jgi:hypothetical protein